MKASEAKEWIEYLQSFRIEHLIIVVLIVVLGYLLINPEKVLVWKGIIQSLFVFSRQAQKESITNRVSGSFKHAAKKMSKEERELIPDSVKIEWKDGENETRESFLNGKQVIVRMNRSDNINKTTAIAALEIAKTGVMANGKRYMDRNISTASDFLTARKLVSYINNGQSLGYFDEIYFRPMYNSDEQFKEYFDQLLATDRNGMYISVFLNEIRKMADLLFPEPANKTAQEETVAFLKFLFDLCKEDDYKNLHYKGIYIRVDVAFTGDNWVLKTKGYDFYVNKCYAALNEGINTVYLFALGMKTHDAIGIENMFNETYPNYANTKAKPYIHTFSSHEKKQGVCIEFQRVV